MKFLVFIWALIISACTGTSVVKQPTLVYKEKGDLYELTIHESGTKTDALGNVQCANYATSHISDSVLTFYGFRCVSAFAFLLDTDEKYIVFEDDKLKNLFLDIAFKSNSDTPHIDKKLISDKLLQQYKLSLTSEESLAEGYDLQIADPYKLNKHKSSFKELQPYTYRNNTLAMPGVSLSTLAKALNQNMTENITTGLSADIIYQFEVKVDDLENLKRQLENEYGLTLSKKKVKVVQHTVERKAPYK